MDMTLRPIGAVRSPLKDRAKAPRQGDEGGPEAFLEIESRFRDGLDGLAAGQEILVVTWLHLADRETLRVHPRGDPGRPRRGVFDARSPDRPNPLGLHRATIVAVEEAGLRVRPLEAVDGTPVVDIKPALRTEGAADGGPVEDEGVAAAAEAILAAGRDGWRRGLLAGFNGNLSVRLPGGRMLVTGSGCAKGRLRPADLALIDLGTGRAVGEGCRPSTEAMMHLEIYRRQPQAGAVLHCHPPRLLALSLIEGLAGLRALPLFEASVYAAMLGVVPALGPGTRELAEAVGRAAAGSRAVFMERHGLTCWGEDLAAALSLGEEIESLAGVRLLTRAGNA